MVFTTSGHLNFTLFSHTYLNPSSPFSVDSQLVSPIVNCVVTFLLLLLYLTASPPAFYYLYGAVPLRMSRNTTDFGLCGPLFAYVSS